MKHRSFFVRHSLMAGVLLAQAFGPAAWADAPSRPYHGSCATVVTPLDDQFLQLHIDLDCILTGLGKATGVATQTNTVVSQNGPVVVQVIGNTTTYTAANGDVLNQSFEGMALLNVVTGEVQYMGTETFLGGTGRFADASGTSQLTGTASLFTGNGFYTVNGTVAY